MGDDNDKVINEYGTELDAHSIKYRQKERWPADSYDYTYKPEYARDENVWWAMSSKDRRAAIDKYQTKTADQALLDTMADQGIEFEPIPEEDIMRTLIDEFVGTISPERMKELLPDWKADAMTAVDWNRQAMADALRQSLGYAERDAAALNAMSRVEAEKMNRFIAEQFYTAMDEATPGLRSLVGKYQGTVTDMLSGDMPLSVRQQIDRASAEQGYSRGLFGEARSYLGSRNIGLTALDYISMGQAQMPAMMATAEAMRPDQIQMDLADTEGLAAQYGSALLGLTTMDPTQAVAAGAQHAQLAIGLETFNQQIVKHNQEFNTNRIADWLRFNSSQGMSAQQFNAQLNYAAALSGLNYSLEQQSFEWNYKIAKMQASAQKSAAKYGMAGDIISGVAQGIGHAIQGIGDAIPG